MTPTTSTSDAAAEVVPDLPLLLFDSSLFQPVVEFLDAQSAMRLSGTCRRSRAACSSPALSRWRHEFVFPAMLRVTATCPRGLLAAPVMRDVHSCWLFDNSPDVEHVDLADAPFPTDTLLEKIASECPNLKSFSVRRGQDALRIDFHEELEGLTTTGVLALVDKCPHLESLCLSWCQSVQGDAVCKALSQSSSACLNIRRLNLNGVHVTDAAVAWLAACTGLRSLRMKDTQASDISPLASCTELVTLHLCRGDWILPEGVVKRARASEEAPACSVVRGAATSTTERLFGF